MLHKKFHRNIKKAAKTEFRILRGFTLIELLVVIGILGLLASVLIFIINPLDQLARARDAGRKSAIKQVGRALRSYIISQSVYPSPAELENALISSGELRSFPQNPSGISPNCSSLDGQGALNIKGYCYNISVADSIPNGAVLYSPLESTLENKKCGSGAAWFVWSSLAGTGIYCTVDLATEPPVIITEFVTGEISPTPTEIPTATPTDIPLPSPSDTPTPLPTNTPTPTVSAPTATPTPLPTATPTPTPVTCVGIGGTCRNSCTGGQTSQGQLDCLAGKVCCK